MNLSCRQTKRPCALLIFSHFECRPPGHLCVQKLSHPQTRNSRSAFTNFKNASSSSLLSLVLPSPASQPHPMPRPPASFQMSTFHFSCWPTYFSSRIVDKRSFISSVFLSRVVFLGFWDERIGFVFITHHTGRNISSHHDNTSRKDSTSSHMHIKTHIARNNLVVHVGRLSPPTAAFALPGVCWHWCSPVRGWTASIKSFTSASQTNPSLREP